MRTYYDRGRVQAFQALGVKTAGPITVALNESAGDYIDLTTGERVNPAKLVLKQLGLADYPEIVPAAQFTQTQNPPIGTAVNPPAPVKTSASKYATTGLLMDAPPREAPEWTPPPTRQRHGLLDDPGFRESDVALGNTYRDTNDQKQDDNSTESIPGDNEAPGGSDGSGSGGPLSRGGAEVPVPDQTPQRQAMKLYDSSSSDVGSLFNFFDQRLQNPATNSIIRFVSE